MSIFQSIKGALGLGPASGATPETATPDAIGAEPPANEILEDRFESAACPRCGNRASGSHSRHTGMTGDFENCVITCHSCSRRSSECAAILSSKATAEVNKGRLLAAQAKALESWQGERPGD